MNSEKIELREPLKKIDGKGVKILFVTFENVPFRSFFLAYNSNYLNKNLNSEYCIRQWVSISKQVQVCKLSAVLSILVTESILVYNSKTCKWICIMPINKYANFGSDRSINFQVLGQKANALPMDGWQVDRWTDGHSVI